MTHSIMQSLTTALMNWVSPAVMQSLGWALLHFLWQGTALAAMAAAAMALCRRSSSRYLIGVGALLLMLAAPLATVFVYSQQHSGVADTAKPLPLAAASWRPTQGDSVASGPAPAPQATPWRSLALDAFPWLVEAWLLGVAFFSLRSAGGFLLLERERRKQSSVVNARVLEICYTLQDQLGLSRAIDYCECKWLQAPAVIGWFRPVVFLPMTALSGLSEDQLQAVIAHELAHIRRFDPFVNVFQVCVETLLFYHPAVWWLNKRVRAEREHCCDDIAVTVCGNAVQYARALTLMEEWRSAPVFAMAANRGPLTERIVRLLGLKTLGAGMRGIGLTASVLCLTAALIAGNALLGMAHPSSVRAASWVRSVSVPQATTKPSPDPSPRAGAAASPGTKPSAGRAQSSDDSSGNATSYIDGMKSAGLGELTIDQLIALKTQDVTPEYVHGLQQQGLNPDVNRLIALKVQGVTPEYVKEMRAAGLNPSEDELVALKVQGIDADYIRQTKDAGISADVGRLIALKVQDVTPEYVKELRSAGLTVTADLVVALKVQDVTGAWLKGMRDQGLQLSSNDAIAMKVQDLTPEYIRDIRALGLNPSANELIGLKVQDVTPEYIKALQSAGFKVGVNDIIGAKVQDVTPEFIERVKKHGFKDLTLQKVIQLRQLGILDSKADL